MQLCFLGGFYIGRAKLLITIIERKRHHGTCMRNYHISQVKCVLQLHRKGALVLL